MGESAQNSQDKTNSASQSATSPQQSVNPTPRIPTSPPIPSNQSRMRLSWLVLLVIVVIAGALIYASISGKLNIDIGKFRKDVPQVSKIEEIDSTKEIRDIVVISEYDVNSGVIQAIGINTSQNFSFKLTERTSLLNSTGGVLGVDEIETGNQYSVRAIETESEFNLLEIRSLSAENLPRL